MSLPSSDTASPRVLEPDMAYGLAASPDFAYQGSGVCFAACASGLWRSTDGGMTWQNVFESLDSQIPITATAVALSPNFASDHSVFAGGHGGIFVSTDDGTTWKAVAFSSPPPLVSTLQVSPNFAEDGQLFAGTMEDGFFRSADYGRTWTPWNFGLYDLSILSLAVSPTFSEDETLFAGTETGLFGSTNGGRAWREIILPFEDTPVTAIALAVGDTGTSNLYLASDRDGLFKSSNRGVTWEQPHIATNTHVSAFASSTAFQVEPMILVAFGRQLGDWDTQANRLAVRAKNVLIGKAMLTCLLPPGRPGQPVLVGHTEGISWI